MPLSKHLPSIIHNGWRGMLDFCFPSLCPGCEARERTAESDRLLCRKCQAACEQSGTHQCQRCAAALGPHVRLLERCVYCRDERYAFESVCAIGPYVDPLRAACLKSKSESGHPSTVALAEQLWAQHRSRIESFGINVVIPTPHHWWEELTRRHLAPETISETLAAKIGCPSRHDLLRKTRLTPKQALLSPTRRKSNLRGAFRISARATFDGANVLLVDDILTTGATAHECAKVLREAGAGKVFVAVLARVSTS